MKKRMTKDGKPWKKPGKRRMPDDERRNERATCTITRKEQIEIQARADNEELSAMGLARKALANYMGWGR